MVIVGMAEGYALCAKTQAGKSQKSSSGRRFFSIVYILYECKDTSTAPNGKTPPPDFWKSATPARAMQRIGFMNKYKIYALQIVYNMQNRLFRGCVVNRILTNLNE
jgi:abortive infection bacteriophage resistance protein